jgi:hypothetical protein
MNDRGWALLELVMVLSLSGCTDVAGPESPPTQPAQDSPIVLPASATKAAGTVRPAAVAGLFYPAEKQALSGQIDKLLSAATSEPIQNLRIFGPHGRRGIQATCGKRVPHGRGHGAEPLR